MVDAVPAAGDASATLRSEYWLGLFAPRPSPALKSQLKLPKDQGLLVEGLRPDSPAAKAGVQQYDILLKGNDKPLTGIQDLLQLIDQVKDGKLTLDLLRAGKHETVTVTPAKRPANEPDVIGGMWIPEGASGQWIDPESQSNRYGRSAVGVPRDSSRAQILPVLPGGPVTALPARPRRISRCGPYEPLRRLESRGYATRRGTGQGRGNPRQGEVGRHRR